MPHLSYVELHCRSCFSFLSGASQPGELVARAAALGYAGLAITDVASLAGVVRAHEAARRLWQPEVPPSGSPQAVPAPLDFQLLIGCELALHASAYAPALRLVVLAQRRSGYGHLSELITLARLRADKGGHVLYTSDLDLDAQACALGLHPDHQRGDEGHGPPQALAHTLAHLRGLPECSVILLPERHAAPERLLAQARWVATTFGDRAALAVTQLRRADDAQHAQALRELGAATGLPLVATGAVLMHRRARKPLQDTLTAIRLNTPLADCGFALEPNAEQHLRPLGVLAELYEPAWIEQTLVIASRCDFTLDELRYEYPQEIVPSGHTPTTYLREQTYHGAARRYPAGLPNKVREQLEDELKLIAELRYEPFFLTVYDITQEAKRRDILHQGRGSAANSAVCYCLGITEVNPVHHQLLFGRFLSRERNEPPDIDVDFEHERREEIIQYIYAKYGVERCALAATLISYRTRSAVRDAGRALGFGEEIIDRLAKSHQWFDATADLPTRLAEIGLDLDAPTTRRWLMLIAALRGLPRHLSQHVGGFVIAADKLSRLVPIENAAMAERRVIQWDKDDLESLGLLKVDVLALGMLSALRRALAFIGARRGKPFTLADIPPDDAPTYAMIQAADTIGVFQIESRAQQSMLPRLKPACFYDLVIEVAIVRPGPIQGGMVHPYLKRRQGLEPYRIPLPSRLAPDGRPYPTLHDALKRTHGVPIFQEQVMQVCMIAAGFSPGEADRLRRSMAAWKRTGSMTEWHQRILDGMAERGYEPSFAESIYQQIEGFADYGFPESHAASFAILTYFSSWLKCHEPQALLAALINSQPMGFYSVSQLVQDARRHGVEVRPLDVRFSHWDCTLEDADPGGRGPAVRLGLRIIKGMHQDAAERIVAWRSKAPGIAATGGLTLEALKQGAQLDSGDLRALAGADALGLLGHRRQQVWATAGIESPRRHSGRLLAASPIQDARLALPEAPLGEAIVRDYATQGLSLRGHPVGLLRQQLSKRGALPAKDLNAYPSGRRIWACGLVTTRQQPETAKGTIFVTLEDETGNVNVIVWRHVRERHRRALLGARLLAVWGVWQSEAGVCHLLGERLVDVSGWLGSLRARSRDFH